MSQITEHVTKAQFLSEYSEREDGKYEWNKGIVEKSSGMSQRDAIFYGRLFDVFCKTSAFDEGGILTVLTDMDTSPNQLRKPDIAFYSGKQILQMRIGENQVAPWVAEVISPTDRAKDINAKLYEYFEAGVAVVWHIFPHTQKVDVYTSPEQVTICRGNTVCDGAPAIPGLQVSAGTLFS